MKRVGKFVLYTILEITGVFLVWWGLSYYGYWIDSVIHPMLTNESIVEKWVIAPFFGFCLGSIFPGLILLFFWWPFCFGIYKWIKWNWKKVGE